MAMLATVATAMHPAEHTLFVLAGLFATWYLIKYFFGRAVGGQQAKGGGPGGAEKDIVGAVVLFAAIVVGFMVATHT